MREGIKTAITHTYKNIKHYYVYRKKNNEDEKLRQIFEV